MKNKLLILMAFAGLNLNLQAMYDGECPTMEEVEQILYKAASEVRTIGSFINNGLSYYQAQDACERGMNLQQAQLAAQQGRLETLESKITKYPDSADWCTKDEQRNKHRCLTMPKFMDAGLEFNRANDASHANLTLEQAILMNETIIKHNRNRGRICEDNSDLDKIIAEIKNKK